MGEPLPQIRRDRALGPLLDARTPAEATPDEVVAQVEVLRRAHKWPAARISFELTQAGTPVSRRTVSRHLAQLGLNRRRFIDPDGASNREPRKIIARRPGHLVHINVKKVDRIPDGGGWRVHGRGSEQAKSVARRKKKTERGGYVYLHSAIDGFSPLAYTEALPDEKAATAVAFLHRARAWFAAHGITRIERTVTDNGSWYRADAFARSLLEARHQRITPYTHGTTMKRPGTFVPHQGAAYQQIVHTEGKGGVRPFVLPPYRQPMLGAVASGGSEAA